MTQNRSHAVMQQRSEPHDSLDDFPTPPWAARALMEHVIAFGEGDSRTVWEPACNRGYLVRGLADYFTTIHLSDIHDYGHGHRVQDFLFDGIRPVTEWIVTNPPFRLAEQFAVEGLERATLGVALLVRTSFIEGVGHYNSLFTKYRPYCVAQFTERVPMVKGRCDPKASTATSYCWIVWTKDEAKQPTELVWIPPCRKQLEREGDYA